MDQEQPQGDVVEEPTLTETKAEEAEGHDGEKPGKVIQTFLVRVTLRLNAGDGADQVATAEAAVPTNDDVKNIAEETLFARLDYFYPESINATVEKV